MKRIAIPALAALAMTGWVAPVLAQQAEEARGAPGFEAPFDLAQREEGRPGAGAGMERRMPHMPAGPHMMREHARRMPPPSPFRGLIFRKQDKALTAAEGQKIAEAILLWHGERDWKVADVAEEEGVIRFAFATSDGGVIARFTMDRRTGRIRRVG